MHLGKRHICGINYYYVLLEGVCGRREGSVCTQGREKVFYCNEFLEIKAQNIPSSKTEALRLKPHVLFLDLAKP